MTKPDSVFVEPLPRLALPEKMEIAAGTEFKFWKERVIKHLQYLSLSLSPRALVPPFELALIHNFGSHENSASAAAPTSFDLGEIHAADITASQPLDRPEIGDRDRSIGSYETPDRIAGVGAGHDRRRPGNGRRGGRRASGGGGERGNVIGIEFRAMEIVR
ncbi:hypothetical protein IEQ34_020741 [Dendrobium chrysotoxum]|uniref:Uncharacterized protein n=1 Tax=Dendrobium chrysotoxum TaxID=161865 RepID=A0AAV7G367_DENCH|nr:hypothetical protein IEQ34_020741 [Dendrobium chrysotoxum]